MDRRRHGDLFPLPPGRLKDRATSAGLDESQRALWIGQALNKLALHGPSNSVNHSVLRSNLPFTAGQEAVADRIIRSLDLHGSCPDGLLPEEALRAVMGGSASYSEVPNHLASYHPQKLKILVRGATPRYIGDFLPVGARALLRNFRSTIVKDPPPELDGFSPYWDPVLRFDRAARLDFVVRLFRAGLLTLRPMVKSTVGVFFVKKKTPEWIRMVIDCRGTNQLHGPPPTTRLGSARCYTDLDLSRLPDGSEVCGMEADVSDCFYRFSLDELAHYFGINHPLEAKQWKHLGVDCTSVFDPVVGHYVTTTDDQILFPCFKVVPMGWSWALFLANEAVLNIASRGSVWAEGILREKKVTPQLDEYRSLLGVYVDNITVIGRCPQDVSERCQDLQRSFDEAGIPIEWSQTSPARQLESVGCLLDFEQGVLMNKPKRVWKFVRATCALLRRSKLKGEVLQIWAGHYTSLCSLAPWGLSVLENTYRFIQLALGRKIRVWASVRHELKTAAAVVWLCWRSLKAPIQHVVEVGDSSSSGFALMAGTFPVDQIFAAIRVHERWRFIPMPEELKHAAQEGPEPFQTVLERLVVDDRTKHESVDKNFQAAGLSTSYAHSVADALREGSFLSTSAIRSQIRAVRSKRVDLEIPALVDPLHPDFCDHNNFRLLWARRWKFTHEHISLKEGRVCLSSLKRASRVVGLFCTRKLTISDNLPAVCAFSRGRSSNRHMNRLCRVAAALQFATGILWHIRHVETHRNVSDRPSRFFDNQSGKVPSAASSCGRRKTVPRLASAVNDPLCGGLSREPCSSSKPLDPYRKQVEDFFPPGGGAFFLELFAGTGRLSDAVRSRGIPVLEPIDIAFGSHCDLRRRETQQLILQWIRRGIIGFIHLGTPCTIWSQARHGVKESNATRAKEELGLELALFSCEVIRWCQKLQIPFSLENPRYSKLFQFEPLLRALHSGDCFYVDLDMCQYGEAYRKSTRFATSFGGLKGLARRCNHSRHDVWLKGQVQVQIGSEKPKYVNRTALAGAYPQEICKCFAKLLSFNHHAEHSDKVEAAAVHFSAALRSVAKRKTARCRPKTDKVSKGGTSSEEPRCELLSQAGGARQFIDFIALGRPKKEAWKGIC